MNDSLKQESSRRVERVLASLRQEYMVVGKTRVRGWHAWLLIGVAAGIAAGIALVANNSGEFGKSRAAMFAIGDRVSAIQKTNVQSRAGGGSVLGAVNTGDAGIVTAGPTPARKKPWWKVKWDKGIEGWSQESYLSRVAQSCNFNGQTVQHGSSVTAYQSSVVPYGESCTSEQRTCSNGTLSGSYANSSCAVSDSGPTNKQTVLTGFNFLYSSSVFEFQGAKHMLTGGWLTEADKNAGPDKLYQSDFLNGAWTQLAPVNWINSGYNPGAKPGYHINDPSVIHPPSSGSVDRSQWLYMYYTVLANDIANGPVSEWSKNHAIGLASSIDGGVTWTDLGIIIPPTASGDGQGAWSPGALAVGNEIWLYYHTGTSDFSMPIDFRQRLNGNGFQPISSPERLWFPENISFNESYPEVTLLDNLDVASWNGNYVMLANTTDLLNIVRFRSSDGLSWYKAESEPRIIRDGTSNVLTPNFEAISAGRYRVYFGYDTGAGSQSIKAWDFALPSP